VTAHDPQARNCLRS